jgi:pimeloyl-ACP methyl ester carboxylesterase
VKPNARRAGLIGAAAGLAGIGVAAGLAAERYAVGRTRLKPDPRAREPFGTLRGQSRSVVADDGVTLHVEEVGDALSSVGSSERPSASSVGLSGRPSASSVGSSGRPSASSVGSSGRPSEAPLTVIFTHGFSLEMASWHYQWRDLSGRDAPGRLVFWDLRGHGRSGPSASGHSTIEWLGRDLRRIIEETAGDGPVVLVGHSMGGMTIMALAEAHPELFGSRIQGIALLSTSAGKVAETLLRVPAPLARTFRAMAPRAATALGRQATVIEHGRRVGSDVSFLFTRRVAFGSDVGPALVEFVERMLAATPFEVIADFLPTFVEHDKLDALSALHGIETLVVVGDRDRITPVDHSRDIAEKLPHAELVIVPSAGHMVMLERPSLVNLHIRTLCNRVLEAATPRAAVPSA